MITNIPISHPLIAILRSRIEQKLGVTMSSQQAIHKLESAIDFAINEDTLRRLWGFREDGYSSVRHSTLDVLCRFIGCDDWATFVQSVQTDLELESELLSCSNQLTADALQKGDCVEISWLPDRRCLLQYEGNSRWQVLAVENSTTLAVGDSFSCRVMSVGQEMLVDDVMHLGQHYAALHLGKEHGLSALRKVNK